MHIWTLEEVETLLNLFEKYRNFRDVGKHMEICPIACRNAYYRYRRIDTRQKQHEWTEKEVKQLPILFEKYGNWADVGKHMGIDRISCRTAYYRYGYKVGGKKKKVFWTKKQKLKFAYLWAFEPDMDIILAHFPKQDIYTLKYKAQSLKVKRLSKILPENFLS